ncbi:uncharacterized protein JCM15063_003084 [Sporobolomyces koalae]|uniref:uncharacterized protein n=1 Tax=Sporobolomyces koalae TaxID=500713 RepID=UPI00317F2CDA
MPTYEEAGMTLEEHEAWQRRAEALPLQVGTELAWTGSSLEPHSHPPSDYPHTRSISPSPLRPLESRLLDPHEGVAAQPWRLELVERLQPSKWAFSQVWRAIASPRDENARIPVVLKLYQESLFPYWQDASYCRIVRGLYPWKSNAKSIREAESYAYSMARDLQGSDIPLCYGFYTFQQPSGEVSVGVVLEDLEYKRKGVLLPKYLERQVKLDSLTFENFDDILCAALRLQGRLHKFGIKYALCSVSQFVLLQSPADRSAKYWTLVGLGFSETRPKLEDDEVEEEAIRNGTSDEESWKGRDQGKLMGTAMIVFHSIDDAFDDLAGGWYQIEIARKRLDFLHDHERLPRLQQQREQRIEQDKQRRQQLGQQPVRYWWTGGVDDQADYLKAHAKRQRRIYEPYDPEASDESDESD